MEVAEHRDVRRSGAVTVGSGRLEHGREPLEPRVGEEDSEPFAHQSFADVVVPVAVRAERRLRVVDVEGAQTVEPDPVVDLGEQAIECVRIGDVVSGRVQVARVEADAEAWMAP